MIVSRTVSVGGKRILAAGFIFAALLITQPLRAENWPGFLGGPAAGVSEQDALPAEWDAEKNIRWKTDVAGRGWSSPVIWGDRLFVTSASLVRGDGGTPNVLGVRRPTEKDVFRWDVFCLNLADGKLLWQRTAREASPANATHGGNTYASETPVTDGKRLYAHFGPAGMYCYSLDGEPLWSTSFPGHDTLFGWGTGSSPVLDGQRLFVVFDNQKESFIVALDSQSGEEIWREKRDEKSSWSTPRIWRNELRTELVTSATNRVRSYDPASGAVLWQTSGMAPNCIPTPVGDDRMLYLSSASPFGNNKPVLAIRYGGSGELAENTDSPDSSWVAWQQDRIGSGKPSPLLYQGRLYLLSEKGLLSCLDAATGEAVYKQQRIGRGGFTASPWAYGDRVFCLNEYGETHVIRAGGEYELLHINKLEGQFLATPAIGDGCLVLRNEKELICVAPE